MKKKTSKNRQKTRSSAAHGSAFPARIVLGTGYPWAMGTGPAYHQISLGKSPMGFQWERLKWRRKLWAKDVPKYRLVLELIETPKRATDMSANDSNK